MSTHEMLSTKLGKLKRKDLREYWKREDRDFTKWLADPENIELLSDEIGIGIEQVRTEASVGRFNVDILASEENTGRKIIIENQLEVTDHTHLGQLITYAAGLEAEFIIWIVREVKDEHKQAVEWLNEHTDDKLNFFLVAIELWQIEESSPAPKFTVISRPNEWKKSVRVVPKDGDLSDTKTMQLEFWQQLRQFASENYPELKLRSPRPQHWYDIAVGRSDCHVALTIHSRENKVGCELYIPDSKNLYKDFLSNRELIEKELNLDEKLDWQELPEKKACRMRVLHNLNFDDEALWHTAFEWLAQTSLKFRKVFSKNWERKITQLGVPEDADKPRR